MRRITPSRFPALVAGTTIAAALAFGATSAVAAPEKAADRFFCGFHAYLESCEQCCGMYQASWEGIECWCGPDTNS